MKNWCQNTWKMPEILCKKYLKSVIPVLKISFQSKINRKLILKSPRFVPFNANLPQIWVRSMKRRPDEKISNLSFSLSTRVRKSLSLTLSQSTRTICPPGGITTTKPGLENSVTSQCPARGDNYLSAQWQRGDNWTSSIWAVTPDQ